MSEDPVIRYDDDGALDEFLGQGSVHLERLDDCSWYVAFVAADGRTWHINVGSVTGRAKGFATVEEI